MSETTEPDQTYRVLARKYRPKNFDDLIGQEPMVRTLSNAFRTGRIAQAYMLTGVRGVGKTTTARILARALNYTHGDNDQPSIDLKEEGEHCQAIIEGRHMDVIEMDAASHTGVDAMRDLIDSAQYRPATARYKVYIIDEVHMLSGSAFNALLKTLEEPPEHVKFIFATTEIRKVPVTVLSRCQRFDLRRVEADVLARHLEAICKQEGVEAEPEALALIARAGDGSVRDSLSMLDQAIAYGSADGQGRILGETVRTMLGLSDRSRIIALFEHVMKGEVAPALEELSDQYNAGAEPLVVLTDLADFIHLVTRLKYVPDTGKDSALTELERTRGKEFADSLSVRILGRSWQLILKGMEEVRSAERPLPAAEMVLVRMTHASSLPAPEDIVKDLTKGDPARPSAGTTTSPAPAGGLKGENGGPVEGSKPSMIAAAPTRLGTTEAPEGGDSQTIAMRQPEPEALPQVEPAKADERVLNRFEELIYLIEDKRDLALKNAVKHHVRLVSFSDGHMEMNLEGNPARDFLTTLSKRLEEWTGKRWMLSVSKEEGAATLAEQERLENEEKLDSALRNPAVNAVLKQFPGSKVVNVRVRNETDQVPAAAPEEKDDDQMDGFFEQ